MPSSKTLIALLLLGMVSMPAWAEVGLSEMTRAKEAGNWEQRQARLATASIIEITVMVATSKGSYPVDITHGTMGTVACVRIGKLSCQPLRAIGVDYLVDDLFRWATAQVPRGGSKQTLSGSMTAWPLPSRSNAGAVQISYGDWSFNPEAGLPMPGLITLRRKGHVLKMDVERFLLRQ